MATISKNNLKIIFYSLLFGLYPIIFITGYLVSNSRHSHNKLLEIRDSTSKYPLINSLLQCDLANFENDKNLDHLRNQIITLIELATNNRQLNTVSVYYRDLNNGPWFGINEKEMFSPASLIKVPLLMTYYKIAESKPEILTQEITNTLEYNPAEQNITPTHHLEKDKKYTIDDLINRMIIYSDNLAYELLLEHVDNQLLILTYTDLGVDITPALQDPEGNIISVKTYASFFRILYNSSYLSKDMSQKALQLLTKTVYGEGITKKLPQNLTISHKFGERQYLATGEKQLHECGIIYTSKPYLLCLMTRRSDFDVLQKTLQNISATIYQSVSPN